MSLILTWFIFGEFFEENTLFGTMNDGSRYLDVGDSSVRVHVDPIVSFTIQDHFSRRPEDSKRVLG